MHQPADFFTEFAPVSKAEWLSRIVKDLKGKPLEDLYWHLNEHLIVDPFGHADDFTSAPLPLAATAHPWVVNEDLEGADQHPQALEALQMGTESLCFTLERPDPAAFLEGIHPDYIELHFTGPGVASGPAAALAGLGGIARERAIPTADLRGSLYFDPATARLPDWRYTRELLEYSRTEFPGFRCLTVDGRNDFSGAESADTELAAVLKKGKMYLDRLTENGSGIDEVAGQLQFTWYIGPSYFVEIAKLRAFRILWFNLLKAYGGHPVHPVLDIRFAPGAYTDDLYGNMVRATTMAMSAVLGGARRLTVRPYDDGRQAEAIYPQSFARRIARNVQHLLKLESGFGARPDPAAGSYYIEKLTAQLAESAWNKTT